MKLWSKRSTRVGVFIALLGLVSLSACISVPGAIGGIFTLLVIGGSLLLGTTQSSCTANPCLSINACLGPQAPDDIGVCLSPDMGSDDGGSLDGATDARNERRDAAQKRRDQALANLQTRLPQDVIDRLNKKS